MRRTFFADTAFVNHKDAVFARLYLDAFDARHAGRTRPSRPPGGGCGTTAAQNAAIRPTTMARVAIEMSTTNSS